ncbi:ectoine/hydroxyectoine ABC transporter substrate-binding protein EhuB [Virgibacillus dakarensis]|uniref:ectoine/hydroxyectoine ABC transporter substrate-binding protein EhuB n=1 Tax=Virgibacillus dakarensis TaxID=1917889 RepID=UPI000B43E7F6|nr:ectoine/hydroxyectoine ABC transporter substrate-binding protein EhuB [Virgibacillus dakarensis]
MKKTLLISVCCLVLIMLAACGSDDASGDGGKSGNLLDELKEKGTVTVGFANEEPYAYQTDDGELKGAAVDIATAVFKELGVDNVKGQLADFKQLIPGLNAGKFDVVTAGMAITPDRCENADFGEPEMMYGEGLIVQKGNPLDLHSYKDLAEKNATVSIMSSATENEFVKKEGVSEEQIQSAPDIPATFSAVESGRADATTGTEMTVKMALESSGNDKLEFVEDFEQPEDIEGVPSYGAAAFHKDNDKLREAYNEKLAELKESGKIAELLEANGFNGETNSVPDGITAESVCSGENY